MTVSNLTITGNGRTVSFGLNEDTQLTRSGVNTGGGGWQLEDRPRGTTVTEWVDVGAFQLTMNLIMDGLVGHTTGTSLESAIAAVEAWEVAAPGSNPPLPPRVAVAGPVPHTDLQWIVYTLTWGNAIRDPQDHNTRWYQELALVLWQYCPSTANTSASSPAQAAAAASSGSATRTYTVKAGDTLTAIAARLLGNANLWTEIASLNGIRDPRSIQPGQVLKIPAS